MKPFPMTNTPGTSPVDHAQISGKFNDTGSSHSGHRLNTKTDDPQEDIKEALRALESTVALHTKIPHDHGAKSSLAKIDA